MPPFLTRTLTLTVTLTLTITQTIETELVGVVGRLKSMEVPPLRRLDVNVGVGVCWSGRQSPFTKMKDTGEARAELLLKRQWPTVKLIKNISIWKTIEKVEYD